MKIINDEFEISFLMEGRFPPNTWTPLGTPLFTETMLLSLTDIKLKKSIDSQPSSKNYVWTNIHYN